MRLSAHIDKIHTQPLVRPRFPRRKRNIIARLLRRFLKYVRDLMEEDTSLLAAINWTRSVKKCSRCKAVMGSTVTFCSVCGLAQDETTHAQVLPSLPHALKSYHATRSLDQETYTGRIAMGALPGESAEATVKRLKNLKAFIAEGE